MLIAPPGSCTATLTVPWLPTRLPGITTVRLVAEITVIPLLMVVLDPPFVQTTLSPVTKVVPVIESVKVEPPTATVFGERVVTLGGDVKVNVAALESTPAVPSHTLTEAVVAEVPNKAELVMFTVM